MSQEYPTVLAHPRPPAHARPPANVRSTLLCSGIAVLRSRGLFESYAEKLDETAREPIVNIIAGVWMPLAIGMAHFQAVDALGLSADDAFAIGASSGRRIHATLLHTLVRMATGAGASPWTVFENYGRLWSRIFDGGRIQISKVGPKDALLEFSVFPPARFAYFRNAFRGVNHAGISLFVNTLYVRELVNRRKPDEFALRISWA
jgi:hypothetical protein